MTEKTDKDWIEDVEADMTEAELKERGAAFDYFEKQQEHLQSWGKKYWEPQRGKLLSRVQKEYLNELDRIRDERKENSDMILTDKVRISLYNGKINNNILTVAGSGRGKTYSVVLPNALQGNASLVFSDPKGDLLRRTGNFFLEEGYKLRVLNLIEMTKSNSYNPFQYLEVGHEEDVMTLIDTIMKNTDGEKKSSDPFWDKGEQLFQQSVFFYVLYELRPEERSIPKCLEIMRLAEIKEENEDHISDYDALMLRLGYDRFDVFDDTDEAWEELVEAAENGDEEKQKLVRHYETEKRKQEEYRDNHIAYIQYKHFKAGAGKTAKSIIISATARLAPFNIPALKNISLYDEMQLDKIGEEKTALFIVLPPTNLTFTFVSGMLLTQLFSELNKCANVKHAKQGGTLPIPVRFILDEFRNTGRIPMFTQILAYARSLNISIMPILQSLEQLKEMYEKEWQVILDNCAMFLFMGGIRNNDTLEYVKKLVGTGTFDKKSHSVTKGTNGSTTMQYDKVGIDLVTISMLQSFPEHECVLFVNGYAPVWEKMYDLKNHPNFARSEDGGNAPYDVDTEEIKQKQEMYKLYLKKINHEDDLDNPKMEFLGNTLFHVFSKAEQVQRAMQKDKCSVHVEDMEQFCNSVTMDEFKGYFMSKAAYNYDESQMDSREVEKTIYIKSEALQELQKEKKRQDNLIDSLYEKQFSLHVLSDKEIIELTKNAIVNKETVFSSLNDKETVYSNEQVKEAEETFANKVLLDDEDDADDGDTDSSDKEENSLLGQEPEKEMKWKMEEPGENSNVSHGEISTMDESINGTGGEDSAHSRQQEIENTRQQQSFQKGQELLRYKENKEMEEDEAEVKKWNFEKEQFQKMEEVELKEKQDAFDKGLEALMNDIDLGI